MAENAFESFVKKKLPREDDKRLFEELYRVYQRDGKEAPTKYLKELIAKLEE
ncbi:MAG: hypothetical protein M1503_03060 [Thaumarchaeota archaeon]|nr:hypothetical protein [Nitrososphaerota archaeon]MCL5317231.1 hypothetical protein [Nitrososphaerota archaeon]